MSFMRVFILMALALAGFAGHASAGFLSALQDVPLPEGVVEMTEQTAVFDKPEGRIVESVADINDMSEQGVKDFYKQTLPQLGWKQAGDSDFRREAEHLHLNFESLEGRRYVRFVLSPAK